MCGLTLQFFFRIAKVGRIFECAKLFAKKFSRKYDFSGKLTPYCIFSSPKIHVHPHFHTSSPVFTYMFTRAIVDVHPFPNVKRAATPPGNSSSTKLKKQLGSFARKETSCFPTTILSSASPAPRLVRSGRGRYRFRPERRVGKSPCLRSAGSRPCARSGHRLALASAGRTAWRR